MSKVKIGTDISCLILSFCKSCFHNLHMKLFSKCFCTNIGAKEYDLANNNARISTSSLYVIANDYVLISRFPP